MKVEMNIKMSTVLVIICLMITLGSVLSVGGNELRNDSRNVQPPFDMIKRFAMNCPLDKNGNYVFKTTHGMGNTQKLIVLMYQPGEKVITIGQGVGNSAGMVHYLELEDKYIGRIIEGRMVVFEQEITMEQAQEFAFDIFRELVYYHSI